MAKYKYKYFRDRHAETAYSAETVLGLLLPALPPTRAAIDVGCGVGTWLAALEKQGVSEVRGLDGPWVDTRTLVISPSSFVPHDLRHDRDFGCRFDLAISIEVAEHLPPERAPGFVRWLTRLSDIVLFSAATPGQGGRNHFNEQWQSYWAALFAELDYEPVDFIRAAIWEDRKIATWYRQNLMVYVRKERLQEIQVPEGLARKGPLSIVHPEVFVDHLGKAATVGGVFKRLRRSVRRSLGR